MADHYCGRMQTTAMLESCHACPKDCGTDRFQRPGACGADHTVQINLATLHYGEEPMLSGKEAAFATSVTPKDESQPRGGSGTIFFSHCNLRCVYCQNYSISHLGWGKTYQPDEILELIFGLQSQGALNINLVSPTQYSPQLIPILHQAKEMGLKIPVVWNSNAYEKPEILRLLKGLVDIWLPDFKYAHSIYSAKYSGAKDYPMRAIAAIREMWDQSGALQVDENGIAQKGVIVRHLVLPNGISGSKQVLQMLASELGSGVWLSIMSQYYPTARAHGFAELNRSITRDEYQRVIDTALELGFENLQIQELISTPDWTPEFQNEP